MQTKLKEALATKEVEYDNFTAELGKLPTTTHRLDAPNTKRPLDLAVKWNNERMETGGAGFDPSR